MVFHHHYGIIFILSKHHSYKRKLCDKNNVQKIHHNKRALEEIALSLKFLKGHDHDLIIFSDFHYLQCFRKTFLIFSKYLSVGRRIISKIQS